MRFTLRFALVMLLPVLVLVTLNGVLRVRRELVLLESEARDRVADVGQLLVALQAAGSAQRAAQVVDAVDPSLHVTVWQPADLESATCIAASELASLRRGQIRDPLRCDDGVERGFYPLTEGGAQVVEVALVPDQGNAYVLGTVLRTVWLDFLIVVAGATAAFVFGRRMFGARIARLVAAAEAIGAGVRPVHVVIDGDDELSTLARALARTADRLDASAAFAKVEVEKRLAALEQLRHADRLITVGQLSAGLAHELATPLNVSMARAQSIIDGELDDDGVRRAATSVVAQSERMVRILRGVLDFARPSRAKRNLVDVAAIARRALEFLQPVVRRAHVEVTGPDDGVRIDAAIDAAQIEQVLVNLAMNAVQAMPLGGKLTVDVSLATHAQRGAGFVRLVVADTGAGISPDHVARIFDPFFTTKDPGAGTGLGLSIVHGIVRDHGGFVEVDSVVDHGSRFSVWLPVNAE